jgi:hypothetical protein
MKGRELLITFFFLLASLEGFAAVVFMFTISAESEKAFLWHGSCHCPGGYYQLAACGVGGVV